jgi:hypothetical protein
LLLKGLMASFFDTKGDSLYMKSVATAESFIEGNATSVDGEPLLLAQIRTKIKSNDSDAIFVKSIYDAVQKSLQLQSSIEDVRLMMTMLPKADPEGKTEGGLKGQRAADLLTLLQGIQNQLMVSIVDAVRKTRGSRYHPEDPNFEREVAITFVTKGVLNDIALQLQSRSRQIASYALLFNGSPLLLPPILRSAVAQKGKMKH